MQHVTLASPEYISCPKNSRYTSYWRGWKLAKVNEEQIKWQSELRNDPQSVVDPEVTSIPEAEICHHLLVLSL